MTFFCPSCWSEIGPTESICPACGADVRALDAQTFSEKLRAALMHPEPQTAVRAAWILGERRDTSAVSDLVRVMERTRDGFLAEAAAEALGKIAEPNALPALGRAVEKGTVRVRNASQIAIKRIHEKQLQKSLQEKES